MPERQDLTWDCHVHVFGDPRQFPFDPSRTYTPSLADADALKSFRLRHGIDRTVIVQPSVYGSDNSCLIDALQRFGGSARGIVSLNPETNISTLRDYHSAGVRGVRLNLETTALKDDPALARQGLQDAAKQIGELGWHIQIYTNLAVIAAVREVIATLSVPVVVDHFGLARAEYGLDQPGFGELTDLVSRGTYVKLSLADRLAKSPDEMIPFAKQLIDANPERVLWGSDWPHSRRGARVDEPAPFGAVDDALSMRLVRESCETEKRLRLTMSTNPARLFA
ncbi:hypothetical protein EN873_23450 [bacterium M00.F.Ca.ET.230.01.1.1]|nr:hypothetical protein EN873_23450 [bacterium M00.F.Ca.ET.230.01.1.1]